ncbi:MAG: SDR family NAD(P)-dependent oxidoreductase [Alphaproteobacteria bacterium]|nr:SDR family NAD(P)-dependent oxidoreductase [Alphaproteobacteria bacterium]MBL7096663.1 SDR family NAD(P)-dependent oxidoreductase [Alphaproteobacteria bacterium]
MANKPAYIITGPTSGIGRLTALELAKRGTVVLVGRNRMKLADVCKTIERRGGRAVSVECDLSDITSVRHAAAKIVALPLPIAGLLNNAGIRQIRPTKSAQGWDMTFATNHLGPFALTEALVPHLVDGTEVVFVVSAVEDPERKLAASAGFRGGRYISAEASARGEWEAGGSAQPGFDSYATSKQAALAAALALARETPRLRINALEPGFTPNTGLGRDAPAALRFVANHVLPLVAPFIPQWSTPIRAARLAAKLVTDTSPRTGAYYDERGRPMQGSKRVRDHAFQDRVVEETRALLAKVSAP